MGERQTIKLLNAVRNVERRPATDTKRGRPPRWNRRDLLRVAGQLRSILRRETGGRISLSSFIGLYLRVLEFPKDVTRMLAAGEVTLFEASQLARLNEKKLSVSAARARERRSEMLKAHLLVQGSQVGLQARVNEQLGIRNTQNSPEAGKAGTELVDELLDFNPYDTRHLFWEELRRIAFAMRDITPEDVDGRTLNELLSTIDKLSGILQRIQKRRLLHETRPRK